MNVAALTWGGPPMLGVGVLADVTHGLKDRLRCFLRVSVLAWDCSPTVAIVVLV